MSYFHSIGNICGISMASYFFKNMISSLWPQNTYKLLDEYGKIWKIINYWENQELKP